MTEQTQSALVEKVDSDPERIWLQPKCCAGEYEGRQWCEHNVFDDDQCEDGNKATEYVRADLLLTLEAERNRVVEALEYYADREGGLVARQLLSTRAYAALAGLSTISREG